jgi:hypothetical protein
VLVLVDIVILIPILLALISLAFPMCSEIMMIALPGGWLYFNGVANKIELKPMIMFISSRGVPGSIKTDRPISKPRVLTTGRTWLPLTTPSVRKVTTSAGTSLETYCVVIVLVVVRVIGRPSAAHVCDVGGAAH